MKKTLAMALLITVIGAMMIAGGTLALFTSTADNTGNTFTSGTVVISDTTGGTLSSQEVNCANLAPGDTKTFKLTVKNNGTLQEWVKLDSANSLKSGALFEGSTPVSLSYDGKVVKLDPNASAVFDVTYSFPINAGNEYAGKVGSFNVAVQSVQVRNNDAGTGPISWN